MDYNQIKINLKEYKKINITDLHNVEIQKSEGDYFSINQTDLDLVDCEILEINKLKATWRDVYHVKLDIKDQFRPGDSVGILCPNKDEYAEKMLKILDLENDIYEIKRDGRNPIDFHGHLFDFFKYVYDFTQIPKKSTLLRLAKGNKYLEYLSSREGSRDYFGMINNWNNILDVLIMFGCKPTLEDLVTGCEILKPRYFSLTNKLGEYYEILVGINSKEVELVGNRKSEIRYGHVSQFILNPNGQIKVCIRESKLIRLNNSKKNLIICTGTGIAPFLSFLKNKSIEQHFWVIYGFRSTEDDLYVGEYENTEVDRVLSSEGKYVTDFVFENLEKVKEYVQRECAVYVCGRMDMQKEIYRIFCSEMSSLVEEKRLFFDNWQ